MRWNNWKNDFNSPFVMRAHHAFREMSRSFSMMFSGKLNMWERGPRSLSISLRLLMSVLFTARIRGVVVR